MSRPTWLNGRLTFRFWLLAAYLLLVFLFGGSARSDVQSLLLLRPLAAVMCGVAIILLPTDICRRYRTLVWFAVALLALPIIQLIPLPPVLWKALPGREIVERIDVAAGLTGTWRPASLDPRGAWNALYSLLVPLAALLLAMPLSRDERSSVLTVLLILGMASGLLGLLQVVGGRAGSLNFYRVTTLGQASGMFANRNHEAALLATLFPMLAVFAWVRSRAPGQGRLWSVLALTAGSVLIPLMLVTGSRAGFILGLLGLFAVPFLYRRDAVDGRARPHRMRSIAVPALGVGVGIAVLALLAILFSRAGAIDRLTAGDQLADLRFKVWPGIAEMAARYFPIGTGLGSFDAVFRLNEPYTLLKPTYLNHAHNDWLETALTGGLAAILLMAAAVSWWAFATVLAWRSKAMGREIVFARLGSLVLAIFALASIVDYPLRVPSIACVAVLAAVWLHCVKRDAGADGARNVVDVARSVE